MALPSRWIRTRHGSYGYVVRTKAGLYRIRWLAAGMLVSSPAATLFTEEELLESKVRFLKKKPAGAPSVGQKKRRKS